MHATKLARRAVRYEPGEYISQYISYSRAFALVYVVRLLAGHSEGTGDAEMLDETELEEAVLEKELEDDMKVVTSDVDV